MVITQPDLWSVTASEPEAIITQDITDGKIINLYGWKGYHGTREQAISRFVETMGRVPRMIHYQESNRLWWVGPLEGAER
jgi:hypothetical protein